MKKVLVTGATGTQGGAVVDALLSGEHGEWEVHGLTRDADSDAAAALAQRGVTVVEGNMTDEKRMRECCEGMDAVYCVTTFFQTGIEDERMQGKTVADAAKDAGVSHFVYSSVGGADSNTGLAHFESKYQVEKHIAAIGLPATVFRPVTFMQNVPAMNGGEIAEGTLSMPLAGGVSLQYVDARDIGDAVALALSNPERFVGQTVHLAGDDLTLEKMATVLSSHLGREIQPVHLDVEENRDAMGDELADMFVWFNDVGFEEDYEAVAREFGLSMHTFAEFVAEDEAFRPAPATP